MLVVSSPASEDGFAIIPQEVEVSLVAHMWVMTGATFLNPIHGKCLYQRVYLVQDEKYDLVQDTKKESVEAESHISKGKTVPFPLGWEQRDFLPDAQVEEKTQQMWFALNKDHSFFLITTFPFYGVSVNYCQFHHLQSEPETDAEVQFKMICVSYNNLQCAP